MFIEAGLKGLGVRSRALGETAGLADSITIKASLALSFLAFHKAALVSEFPRLRGAFASLNTGFTTFRKSGLGGGIEACLESVAHKGRAFVSSRPKLEGSLSVFKETVKFVCEQEKILRDLYFTGYEARSLVKRGALLLAVGATANFVRPN